MDEKELVKSIEIFAHKIKNPLHALVINLDVLKVKLQKQLKDRQTFKHLEIVKSEVKHLSEIVTKYLDYLKLSDKEKSKIDLRKLLG